MINLIAAITYFPREDQFIIGANGDLPHSCPEDMKRFKKLTSGGVVIMGRKTYETLGKPLPNRFNIVLSTNENYPPPEGGLLSPSLEASLEFCSRFHPDKEVWIMGGGQVYREAIEKDIPGRLYISEMKEHFEEAVQLDSKSIMFGGDETKVIVFPRVNMSNYKALYIEQFEDHTLKILSKESLDVL